MRRLLLGVAMILLVLFEIVLVIFLGVIAWVVVVEPCLRPFSKTLQYKDKAFEAELKTQAANNRAWRKANYYWDPKTRGYRVRR